MIELHYQRGAMNFHFKVDAAQLLSLVVQMAVLGGAHWIGSM